MTKAVEVQAWLRRARSKNTEELIALKAQYQDFLPNDHLKLKEENNPLQKEVERLNKLLKKEKIKRENQNTDELVTLKWKLAWAQKDMDQQIEGIKRSAQKNNQLIHVKRIDVLTKENVQLATEK